MTHPRPMSSRLGPERESLVKLALLLLIVILFGVLLPYWFHGWLRSEALAVPVAPGNAPATVPTGISETKS